MTTQRDLLCPGWCLVDHEDPDEIEYTETRQVRAHARTVSSFWLHQLRIGMSGRLVRPAGELVEVGVEQVEADGGERAPGTVNVGLVGEESIRLTSSEARSVAAMLLRAADLLEDLA